MTILQINCVFRRGSTGKITADLHDGLRTRGIDSHVVYGRQPIAGEENVMRTSSEFLGKWNNGISRLTGIPYGGCRTATNRLFAYIRKIKPDVVHLHCINGFFVNIYRLLDFLKREKIATVLTLHAEFMYTGSCGYAYDCEKWKTGCGNCSSLRYATNALFADRTHAAFEKMKAAFAGFGDRLTVVSVSPWLSERAMASPILGGFRHEVITNGIDRKHFYLRDADTLRALREKYAPGGEKIILHPTAAFSSDPEHIKGGAHVIALAKRLSDEPIRILVAGNPAGVLTDLPKNITLLGRIDDQEELASLYAAADLVLLTSRRETYSMPVAEGLSCGTPVVGFQAGGPERIALPEYSRFVPYGDLDMLERAVRAEIGRKADGLVIPPAESAVYSKETMVERYLAIYRSMGEH